LWKQSIENEPKKYTILRYEGGDSLDLKLVSLFTGAGGLDYGFEEAGFEVRAALEIDHDCCETIRANRQWEIIQADINRISSKEILDKASVRPKEIDVLTGGPPCQPFSKSGYWVNGDTKRLKDPRSNTLYAYMRCVEEMLPEVFFLENVHGIKYSGKEEGFYLMERLTKKINREKGTNYRLAWNVLNAADYGVPQIRNRFFIIGHREGAAFNFPTTTHVAPLRDSLLCALDAKQKYVTSWDAIGGLKPLPDEDLSVKGKWGDLLPSIPEGENYLWHTARKGGAPIFGWRTRYWSFLLKLAKNKPSWTIQAQPGPAIGPFHWNNRRLSIEEMAKIQTFPDNIVFMGKRNSIQKQIGNAVPSLLAEVLSRSICKQFFNKKIASEPKLSISLKRPIPPPEQIVSAPEKYLYEKMHEPDIPVTPLDI